MYVYIKKVRKNGRTYHYLVVEEYIGKGMRRSVAHISVQRIIERLLGDGLGVCGAGGGIRTRAPLAGERVSSPSPWAARAPRHPLV